MFDNLTGAVGFAMHEDRLAKAVKNLRLAEAKQGRRTPIGMTDRRYRAKIAGALVVLAIRIAPMVMQSRENASAIAR